MFDLSFWELAIVGIVALLVIGPKELPNALRHLGRLTGKARAMTRHVRSGFDEMVRQAEMEEMEKQWRQKNADIMAAHPQQPAPHVAQPHGFGHPPDPHDELPVDPMAPPAPPRDPTPGEPLIAEPTVKPAP